MMKTRGKSLYKKKLVLKGPGFGVIVSLLIKRTRLYFSIKRNNKSNYCERAAMMNHAAQVLVDSVLLAHPRLMQQGVDRQYYPDF
jgi:hypothetical protein